MESKDKGDLKSPTMGNGENTTAEFAVDDKRTRNSEQKELKAAEAAASPKEHAAEDAAIDAELSSPPSSSSVSSVNPDMLGDEIVVGTRANGVKSPAPRVTSERDDVEMADAEEDEEPVNHYPKRKRYSQFADLSDEAMDSALARDSLDENSGTPKGRSRQKLDDGQKQVVLGAWRDSPVPHDAKRHSVVGFIDIRDRLRTRVVAMDVHGDPVNARLFPIPPGPGGSWVTFSGIVFLDHLVGHDHNVIKEYVKVRKETYKTRTADADTEAIREAQRRLEANPPPESAMPIAIAWGQEIPDPSRNAKRRRYGSGVGTIADRSEMPDREQDQQVDYSERAGRPERERTTIAPQVQEAPQAPRKPTRILVGVWAKSSQAAINAKHAVYGILGANDMFRVKLVRETIEGKFVGDNFPQGAGALWINYEDVIFLDHLKDLTRPEIKEYVRIRQTQIDAGEMGDEQRIANERKAVHEAQARVAETKAEKDKTAAQGSAAQGPAAQAPAAQGHGQGAYDHHEPRPRREAPRVTEPQSEPPQLARKPLPNVEIRQASRRASNDPLERVQGLANREVAKMEASQVRTDQRHSTRNAMMSPGTPIVVHDNHRHFQDNVHRMQQVWEAKENMRRDPVDSSEDVMMHKGVRYERKQNGPFKDRLVSQGTIINIDGEDYVEYRVLTKPSFF
ncbi:hypothetical protein GGR52DRAFT_47529 [Hypoxylon sp. FL1284]|nr:hypothetical protein GGR52DRAFT_47529 [Hypoxylon sp. FL1284]